jgi:hypothetical protein
LRGLGVEVGVAPGEDDSLMWTIRVDNASDDWTVWRVTFPQLALADLGEGSQAFFPRGAGEVQHDLWQRSFQYTGTYPSGWTSMQFFAVNDKKQSSGIYLATHDPLGSTKEIRLRSDPSDRKLVLAFDHPAADMSVAGNDFALSGVAVMRLFAGDWFDAAVTYRNWARRHAKWYPRLSANGRDDTPDWMRELPLWALGGGAPDECAPSVVQLAEFFDVPVGFHWYNWHQIPFDNDYPHYFPTKAGFADAVRDLQESNVYVMPYINGRLWDTRDRGTEDFQFTQVAQVAAAKDEDGKPYTEMYGSKESDGSRVALAPMCPATNVWQDKVREVVLRLFTECGVKAVYIDQIAAASPRLCFDASHGHPLGGGHWWTDSYWNLLEQIHQRMPDDRMLTTECNAEPYAHWFDGYLTWHWQYDGQVPAFPAVYGGAIQMFGRAYRGGPSKDLALRMKAGQQLVFGEQIGWINPGVIREKENAEFLRQVVQLRWSLRRYFYQGQMERPPVLVGDIPRVTADWQWQGEWPVTTDAVMSGAWSIPREDRVVLLFVNVADQPVSAQLEVRPGEYGLSAQDLRVTRIDAAGAEESLSVPALNRHKLALPPRTAFAWEITD